MNIFVTGAAGFIGSHLAETLARAGHRVSGIDNFNDYYNPALKRINAEAVARAGVTLHEADLLTADLAPLLAGAEAVYHCAAQPGNSATTSLQTYVDNNLYATHRLLEAARQLPALKIFVNIATSSVYGAHATDSEDTPAKPISYYGVTKLAAEQLALAYHRDKGFPATSLRLFSVYGPRERTDKLFPKLIASILNQTEFPLYEGSREHSRSFTYVEDVMAAFVRVLECSDACLGEILNIGSDIEITTGQGMEIVEEIIGRQAPLKMLPPRPGDQLRTCANIEKARHLLNYAPAIAPREGLSRTVEWYKKEIHGRPGL